VAEFVVSVLKISLSIVLEGCYAMHANTVPDVLAIRLQHKREVFSLSGMERSVCQTAQRPESDAATRKATTLARVLLNSYMVTACLSVWIPIHQCKLSHIPLIHNV